MVYCGKETAKRQLKLKEVYAKFSVKVYVAAKKIQIQSLTALKFVIDRAK